VFFCVLFRVLYLWLFCLTLNISTEYAGKADVCEPEHAGCEQQLHQVSPHPDQGQMENGHYD
jgi:hypothetical protein